MLEPDVMKVARPVLRGLGAGNGLRLLGEGEAVRPLLYSTSYYCDGIRFKQFFQHKFLIYLIYSTLVLTER